MNYLYFIAFLSILCLTGFSTLSAQPDNENVVDGRRWRGERSGVEQRTGERKSQRYRRDQQSVDVVGQKEHLASMHEFGGKMLRQVMALKMESERLYQDEQSLGEQEKKLARMIRKEGFSPERVERIKKIIVLRTELVELEQVEFCDKIIAMTDKAITELEKKLEAQEDEAMDMRMIIMRDMLEKSKNLNAAAHTGFYDVYQLVSELGPPESSWGTGREERWQREMEMLRDRLGRLEEEMEGRDDYRGDERPERPERPDHPNRPRPDGPDGLDGSRRVEDPQLENFRP